MNGKTKETAKATGAGALAALIGWGFTQLGHPIPVEGATFLAGLAGYVVKAFL